MVIHQDNKGCSAARNAAMDLAKGEYIQFLDSDDQIDTTMSEKCYNAAKKYDADIVKCNSINHMAKCRDLIHVGPVRNYHVNLMIVIWNGIWKNKFLRDNNIKFDQFAKSQSDGTFNLTCFPLANKVVCLSEKLYRYRYNKNSITYSYDIDKLFKGSMQSISAVYKNWKEKNNFCNDTSKIGFLRYFLRMSYWKPKFSNNKAYQNALINALGSELLQDNVINQLPTKERMQLRQIIQKAKEA